jgi:Fe-S cluster assembly scaffold protein SufB
MQGHIQCDSIIMDNAVIQSTPKNIGISLEAQRIHERQMGKIESQQLIKLMSLGFTEKEAKIRY